MGESTFIISVRKSNTNSNCKIDWVVQAVFAIELHEKKLSLLKWIKLYFGGIGSIERKSNNKYYWRVSSTKDLIHTIIPHFEKYPLITKND